MDLVGLGVCLEELRLHAERQRRDLQCTQHPWMRMMRPRMLFGGREMPPRMLCVLGDRKVWPNGIRFEFSPELKELRRMALWLRTMSR